MPYELIDHTADTGFEATGPTLSAAFADAVAAVAAIVHQDATVEPDGTDRITVTAENPEALLFDVVGRLIYLQDADARLVCGARAVEVAAPEDGDGDWGLEAELATASLDRGVGLLDLKGPTYSEMLAEETEDGWRLRAVIDI